ncbi:MAG: glycolate oxidase subunit GlcE [Pseudomonadales bacterium]|nr:glycolate oxidase subunit GlcE [Pseudomonadales bacterium]
MPPDADIADYLQDAVAGAAARGGALCISGSGSKAFLAAGHATGPQAAGGQLLSTTEHTGIIDYRPEELVLTARAGTSLAHIEATLGAAGQRLPFEPPRFRGGGTLGGAVACGLSGPGRPWFGALRDAVLGVELINGLGERLRFGGQVMKNVAGYDLARLQAGAFGTLGLLLSVSLKVLPRPQSERTLVFELDPATAVARCRAWARQPYPLTGACHADGVLRVRLAGAPAAVDEAAAALGGDGAAAPGYWDALRDHALDWFRSGGCLWRLSVPPAADPAGMDCLINWAGAERWWSAPSGDDATARMLTRVAQAGGHARRFDATYGIQQPTGPAATYVRRLKAAFDPARVLNPHLSPADAY